MINRIDTGVATRDFSIHPPAFACSGSGLVSSYTPHWSMQTLYAISDHHRFYKNLQMGYNFYKGVQLDTPNYYIFRAGDFSSGTEVMPTYTSTAEFALLHYWRFSAQAAKDGFLESVGLFDSASFNSSPLCYRKSYWTRTGLDFYNANIRRPSLQKIGRAHV